MAYREAGHAVCASVLEVSPLPANATIVPYRNDPAAERFMPGIDILESGAFTASYLENLMVLALGGVAAEGLVYSARDIITNVQGDMQQVDCSRKTRRHHDPKQPAPRWASVTLNNPQTLNNCVPHREVGCPSQVTQPC